MLIVLGSFLTHFLLGFGNDTMTAINMMMLLFKNNMVGTPEILGMSWGVQNTCFEASESVTFGGSGVFIGGVRILRVLGRYLNARPKVNEVTSLVVCPSSLNPRDPGSPSENGFLEPKYFAFRR